jgi:hypothetical protein
LHQPASLNFSYPVIYKDVLEFGLGRMQDWVSRTFRALEREFPIACLCKKSKLTCLAAPKTAAAAGTAADAAAFRQSMA